MPGDKTSRREPLKCEAVNPEDGQLFQLTISHVKLMSCRTSLGRVNEAAYTVQEVLCRPSAIFEGLKREADEPHGGSTGWRCYCGVPSKRFLEDGKETQTPNNRVFLIFVDHDRIVYNWHWVMASDDDPKLPIDYNTRFSRQVL